VRCRDPVESREAENTRSRDQRTVQDIFNEFHIFFILRSFEIEI
jgi:hypothetical protein